MAEIITADFTGVEDPYNPGMDYPTAWAIQREVGDKLKHDPRCSSRPEWGMLCDCGAIVKEWERITDLRTGLALSVQQPWAWLIIRPDVTDAAARAELRRRNEIKDIENRSWPTKVRGWIGIHAGKKIDSEGYEFVRREFPPLLLPKPHEFERGGIVGMARLTGCVEESDSPWFFGPYGFTMEDAEPLPFRPCRGKLGFFRPEFDSKEVG